MVGVEFGLNADWQGGVHRDVAKGQAGNDGYFQRGESLAEDFAQGLAIFLRGLGVRVIAIGIQTDGDAGDLLEQAAVGEISEHSIPAIRRFANVFEEEDGVLERGLPGRPDDGAEQGQVAADEVAAGDAAPDELHGLVGIVFGNVV